MTMKYPDSHDVPCKNCGKMKRRIRLKDYNKKTGSKTPKWVDEEGHVWNGLTCPKCHSKKVMVKAYVRREVG